MRREAPTEHEAREVIWRGIDVPLPLSLVWVFKIRIISLQCTFHQYILSEGHCIISKLLHYFCRLMMIRCTNQQPRIDYVKSMDCISLPMIPQESPNEFFILIAIKCIFSCKSILYVVLYCIYSSQLQCLFGFLSFIFWNSWWTVVTIV